MWEYTDTVREHFLNPRNVGEVDNPDAVGEVGNITCGDMLRLTLRIDKETERILEARFKTFGCASAIASSSALTELIKGKTVDEAVKVTNDDIAQYLGGLPEAKMHCSVLGRDALEKAIAGYRGESHVDQHDEGAIVCTCFGVTDATIERIVRENDLKEVEQVTHYCKAGGGCGGCHGEIEEIIRQVHGEKEPASRASRSRTPAKGKLTNIEKMRLITDTIDREIRPQLRKDGGDMELVDIEGDKVLVTLRGACSMCAGSEFTLQRFVQSKLREFVTESIVVEEIK